MKCGDTMINILRERPKWIIDEPDIMKLLLSDPRASILWLLVRVWLGWQWIDAAAHKIGVPAWTETGDALRGYWEGAIVIPETGNPPISFDWYRSFIQFLLEVEAYTWFAKLIAYGELFVGIALIVGAFVGIAAFFGGLMNWNFMMAGSAGSNPLLFVAAIGLILAWKIAGYIGFDFYLLSWIGTPWNRKVIRDTRAPSTQISTGS